MRTPRGNGYYPDVLLVCGPAAHRLYETDADVIVEVLSDSTEGVDRRETAEAYAEGRRPRRRRDRSRRAHPSRSGRDLRRAGPQGDHDLTAGAGYRAARMRSASSPRTQRRCHGVSTARG
ncbi:MAG: Uma2 family endonuclease [Acidimicrobiales bacterium]